MGGGRGTVSRAARAERNGAGAGCGETTAGDLSQRKRPSAFPGAGAVAGRHFPTPGGEKNRQDEEDHPLHPAVR